MNRVFAELPEDKQKRILNAAYAEFGMHGYKNASTNRMVQAAGISKGTLFYYFNSKNELFNDLVDRALDSTVAHFGALLAANEPDYFDRLLCIAKLKLEYQRENGEVLRFMGMVFVMKDRSHLRPEVRKKYDDIVNDARKKVARQENLSAFRTDVDPVMMRRMVGWIIEGYEKDMVARMEADSDVWQSADIGDSWQKYWDDYYQFIAVLKRIFYKDNTGEADEK